MKCVPEGFELTEIDIKRSKVHYAYSDSNGQHIFFDQRIYEKSVGTDFMLDRDIFEKIFDNISVKSDE